MDDGEEAGVVWRTAAAVTTCIQLPFGFKQRSRLDEHDRNAVRLLDAEHDAEVFLTQCNKATNWSTDAMQIKTVDQ